MVKREALDMSQTQRKLKLLETVSFIRNNAGQNVPVTTIQRNNSRDRVIMIIVIITASFIRNTRARNSKISSITRRLSLPAGGIGVCAAFWA